MVCRCRHTAACVRVSLRWIPGTGIPELSRVQVSPHSCVCACSVEFLNSVAGSARLCLCVCVFRVCAGVCVCDCISACLRLYICMSVFSVRTCCRPASCSSCPASRPSKSISAALVTETSQRPTPDGQRHPTLQVSAEWLHAARQRRQRRWREGRALRLRSDSRSNLPQLQRPAVAWKERRCLSHEGRGTHKADAKL